MTANRALRLFGPLERQIVMNILWLDASIPASNMSSWVVREGKKSVFWRDNPNLLSTHVLIME